MSRITSLINKHDEKGNLQLKFMYLIDCVILDGLQPRT